MRGGRSLLEKLPKPAFSTFRVSQWLCKQRGHVTARQHYMRFVGPGRGISIRKPEHFTHQRKKATKKHVGTRDQQGHWSYRLSSATADAVVLITGVGPAPRKEIFSPLAVSWTMFFRHRLGLCRTTWSSVRSGSSSAHLSANWRSFSAATGGPAARRGPVRAARRREGRRPGGAGPWKEARPRPPWRPPAGPARTHLAGLRAAKWVAGGRGNGGLWGAVGGGKLGVGTVPAANRGLAGAQYLALYLGLPGGPGPR